MMKEQGFTLAEVLLTLATIGVVAALTIPAVVTKVTQDQHVVGLKKAHNTLKTIEREAVQEHGEMENWDWSGDTKTTFSKYFKPHFDTLKDCGATTDAGCFADLGDYKFLNNANWTADFNTGAFYKIMTSDGISYAYYKAVTPNRQGHIFVDVNGKKGPNIRGRDFFGFEVFPSLGIKPAGTFNNSTGVALTSAEINAASDEGCNHEGGNGGYCPAKILSEGAMNY